MLYHGAPKFLRFLTSLEWNGMEWWGTDEVDGRDGRTDADADAVARGRRLEYILIAALNSSSLPPSPPESESGGELLRIPRNRDSDFFDDTINCQCQ